MNRNRARNVLEVALTKVGQPKVKLSLDLVAQRLDPFLPDRRSDLAKAKHRRAERLPASRRDLEGRQRPLLVRQVLRGGGVDGDEDGAERDRENESGEQDRPSRSE